MRTLNAKVLIKDIKNKTKKLSYTKTKQNGLFTLDLNITVICSIP